MSLTIVGIDCATDPARTGLALGRLVGNALVISEVTTGSNRTPVSIVNDWISESGQVLLAFDAPLGWPAKLGSTVTGHFAGEGITESPDNLFQRETDRFVSENLAKQPLEVGADRIARTACAALNMLEALRRLSGSEIPLAWSPKSGQRIEAIEVYPAGTLTALGLPNRGYKQRRDGETRRAILTGIRNFFDFTQISEESLTGNADLLDATICALAARDFHEWKVMPPRDLESAQKEGWIWVRPRGIPAGTNSPHRSWQS
jgi:predicted RNase H-like nuclease